MIFWSITWTWVDDSAARAVDFKVVAFKFAATTDVADRLLKGEATTKLARALETAREISLKSRLKAAAETATDELAERLLATILVEPEAAAELPTGSVGQLSTDATEVIDERLLRGAATTELAIALETAREISLKFRLEAVTEIATDEATERLLATTLTELEPATDEAATGNVGQLMLLSDATLVGCTEATTVEATDETTLEATTGA